jgi:ABC-type uncharacterized transport system substrate-binding protein
MRHVTCRRWRRLAWVAPALFIAASALPGPVAAHPHIWITNTTTFLFDGAHVVGVRQSWTFDPFFSSFLIEEFDESGDGRFSEAEQEILHDHAFVATAEYGYFTHLHLGDGRPFVTEVTDFTAEIEGDTVRYAFTVPLAEPVDPVTTPVRAAVYDETFYVDLQFDPDDPVRLEGLTGLDCRFELGQDMANPIYFNMVYPPLVTLVCSGAGT